MNNDSNRSSGGDRPDNKRRRVEGDDIDGNGDMLALRLGRSSSQKKTPPPVEPHRPPRAAIRSPDAGAGPFQIGPTTVQHQPPNTVNGNGSRNGPPNMMINGVVNGALRNHHPVHGGLGLVASARPSRGRHRATHPVRSGRKSPTIAPPHPWATERRASVYPIQVLTARGIAAISGDMQCKRCERPSRLEYNLAQQFTRISNFVNSNRDKMRDRAPIRWLNPALPKCPSCEHENSLKPVIAEKKRNINWLFLLLGEMLGCCTLEQLKYFCKHTGNHRTGAKDRVLYLAYLALCKQLDPTGPFDR